MGHSFSSEAGQAREVSDNGPRKREDESGTTRGRSLEDLAAGQPKPNPREDRKSYSGAVNVGPGFVRDEGSLVSQQRPQQEETPNQRRSLELFDYFTAKDRRTEARRPGYEDNEENWHSCFEITPILTNISRSIEGMSSFKESAY